MNAAVFVGSSTGSIDGKDYIKQAYIAGWGSSLNTSTLTR